MSILQLIFGSFGGLTGEGASGQIGLGTDVTFIQNNPKAGILGASRMPSRADSQMVIAETEKASELEGQQKILQELSQAKLRQVRAGVGAYQVFASHQAGVMQAEQRVAQIDQKHGKNVLVHNHKMGVQRAELSGYANAYHGAMSGFDF